MKVNKLIVGTAVVLATAGGYYLVAKDKKVDDTVHIKKHLAKMENAWRAYIEPMVNPADIHFGDYIKLTSEWSAAVADVLHGARMLDSIDKPKVAIFGGTYVQKKDPYYKKAFELARRLADKGYAIITGGGSGIMEAGNCGAVESGLKSSTSIAIGVKNLGTPNACVQKRLATDDFFPRKWLLMQYSSALIVFPGGIGTMDELSEAVTLISTHNMRTMPIYVIGGKYWTNFKKWLNDARKKDLLSQKAYDLMVFTDDVDEIISGIDAYVQKFQPNAQIKKEEAKKIRKKKVSKE